MDVVIDHNPACGTSRTVPATIRGAGVEPRVVGASGENRSRAATA